MGARSPGGQGARVPAGQEARRPGARGQEGQGPGFSKVFTWGRISIVGNRKQLTLCKSCRSPKCTNPACTTCQVCRSPLCANPGVCGKELVPVNPKQLPATEDARSLFRCQACRYPPCKACGKQMPKGTKARFEKSGHTEWTCGDCLTLAVGREDASKKRGKPG